MGRAFWKPETGVFWRRGQAGWTPSVTCRDQGLSENLQGHLLPQFIALASKNCQTSMFERPGSREKVARHGGWAECARYGSQGVGDGPHPGRVQDGVRLIQTSCGQSPWIQRKLDTSPINASCPEVSRDLLRRVLSHQHAAEPDTKCRVLLQRN